MGNANDRITEITDNANSEGREFTDAERGEISDLVGTLKGSDDGCLDTLIGLLFVGAMLATVVMKGIHII